MQVELGGAAWRLLPGRAAWWESERTLVLADAHFGKAATFRARGVPVPSGTTAKNLQRMTALIDALGARRVIFLGDLFHAREAHAPATVAALTAWRQAHAALQCVLVEGNHDRSAGAPPPGLRLQVQPDPWRQGPFAFCHEPRFVDGAVALAGHLHPCVNLHGRAADSARLACFWIRPGLAVLPSFGEFTGGASIQREPGDRVIAVVEDALIEIPAHRPRPHRTH
jgi:DNA ligase-associated metallophosphoesterase